VAIRKRLPIEANATRPTATGRGSLVNARAQAEAMSINRAAPTNKGAATLWTHWSPGTAEVARSWYPNAPSASIHDAADTAQPPLHNHRFEGDAGEGMNQSNAPTTAAKIR
jgi:hypothetical protein